jgi:hypothetical protein
MKYREISKEELEKPQEVDWEKIKESSMIKVNPDGSKQDILDDSSWNKLIDIVRSLSERVDKLEGRS